MTETMKAFHGEPGLKEMYLARVVTHREADELIQGTGWENGKGCAIGCTLENYSHAQYEVELGVPEVLARLQDRIFEELPHTDAMLWPERFLDAIEPGADLSDVWPQFAVWLLVDPAHGVIRHAKTEQTKKAIADVADLWRERAPSSDPRWQTARAAADAAAAAAATYAYAAAAYAAADAAAYAGASAAGAAGAAAAAGATVGAARAAAAARIVHWKACADKLEELLRAAR